MAVHGDYGDYSKKSTRATWEDVAAARAAHIQPQHNQPINFSEDNSKKRLDLSHVSIHCNTAAYAN